MVKISHLKLTIQKLKSQKNGYIRESKDLTDDECGAVLKQLWI